MTVRDAESSDRLAPASAQAAVKLLCDRGSHPRLAMRGTSMLPLLREPMVLELTRFTGTPIAGEILVFGAGDVFVAHRFIKRLRDGTLILAGDARRGVYDRITPERVIGTVRAVWSGPESDARRLDRPQHRGRWIARRTSLALSARHVRRRAAWVFERADPRRRPRAYLALFNALAAILGGDGAALRKHLTFADAGLLLAVTQRHRCAPLLLDGIEALGAADVLPVEVIGALRKERWAVAARTRALRQQLDAVIALCTGAGVVPVLLKGAARLYRMEPGFDRHDSDDIDILIPHDRIEALTAAFHATGYRQDDSLHGYYATKHHTAPLIPKTAGTPVELHHALAPRSALRTRTDLESFAGRIRFAESANGRIGLLDDAAGALHSTIHAREPTPLRNLVILAQQLRRISERERTELYAIANREGIERARMHAALHAASRLAGLPSDATTAGRRLFAWRLRRFDLPLTLSIRMDAVEWFVATSGRGIASIARSFLPWENDRERALPPPARAASYLVKLCLKPAIFATGAAYAALMPEAPGEGALVGLRETGAIAPPK